ncbi:hypothetical protein [Curtobacterium sp. VKM Ac-1376]|uniref:hypothetical protein n=1 Tax=Curtobacterium sp. VKM Ac-1376 TaxID=123312 RepID=UPI001E514415|nr:hypothetical protein [Curtobacterium sp. VKM Ac-1376]
MDTMTTRLEVPVTTVMAPLGIVSNRVQTSEDLAATDREDLSELGQLLAARGADAAWALLDEVDDSIASWIALTLRPLGGAAPGVVRRAARYDDPIESDEAMRNTTLGRALRLRQRAAITAPRRDEPNATIVSESLNWSWVLPADMMLCVHSNTTQLVYADWVARHVDLVANGIDVVH